MTGALLSLGLYRIFIRLTRGQPAELGMLVGEALSILPAVGASVLSTLGVAVGLLLFVVPGIVFALGVQFALYALVAQDLGVSDALSESWRLTRDHRFTLLFVNILLGLLGLLFGVVTLGFGFVLLSPAFALLQAIMFHTLTHLAAGWEGEEE